MPHSWHRVILKDLLDTEFPGEWGGLPLDVAGNARVLRSTNLDDEGHLDYETAAERQVSASKLRAKKLIKGDILLEGSGGGPRKPVGRVGWFTPPDDRVYLASNFFRTLRPNNSVNGRFLFWRLLLAYYDPRIWSFQQQTTGIINLKASEYLEQELEIPPLPEQRRIAEILDAADEAIRQTERVIAKLKAVKAGLLHDLLTRGLDEHDRLRDPQAHPEQFKDSPLGRIPRDWELTNVGSLGTWKGGSTPSKSIPSNWSDGNIVWISPKDVRDTLVTNSEDKITQQALNNSTLTLFEPSNVIVVFRSGILRHTFPVAVVQVPFTVNQDMKVLLPRAGVHGRFAFWSLQGIGPRVLRLAVKAGTTVESIDAATFYNLPTVLPSEKEQAQIADVLDAHDARIRAEEAELAKLRQVKRGLMDDLLTGRVRVA